MSLVVPARFSNGTNPLAGDAIKWNRRDVVIRDGSGIVFQQDNVEAPASWSDRAVEQPARLYFRTIQGKKEDSIRQMVSRVVFAIANQAVFPDYGKPLVADGRTFANELATMVLDQMFAWNTPVWVNAGAALPDGEKPQCSACFIQDVEDTMESIMALQQSETMLFRRGSGTGTNFSKLRPNGFPLSRGGKSSGPVSFMLGYDAWAGVTKSGGSSRRAAKMCVLNVDHPDIEAFIKSKITSGRMIRDLVAAGWAPDFNEVATSWARYQNANHSVRVSDAFMRAVDADAVWPLVWNGKTIAQMPARKLWRQICEAAWECGDPGLQFDGTANAWHTSPENGRINGSNPCSEYMFVDDSACNLASLRLTKFYDADRGFLIDDFKHAVRTIIISMEAIVGLSGYPTAKIAENSRNLRPLGIGYADLGALLMRMGLPYDSDEGRQVAADITSLMTATAYTTSAEIAANCGGPFPAYGFNREAMLAVIKNHSQHQHQSDSPVANAAHQMWQYALEEGGKFGFRNAQASVIAPTGTIAFMMGADTTGIEPETGLVRRKRLAGGGDLRLVNQSVSSALRKLGYSEIDVDFVLKNLEKYETVAVKDEHQAVFQTAFGDNPIRDEAHVLMVAAVQPFVSGAVSKTVNMAASATPEDVSRLYTLSHKLGLKAVAVYRDGSKGSQPLTVKTTAPVASFAGIFEKSVPLSPERIEEAKQALGKVTKRQNDGLAWGSRKRMPSERDTKTKKFILEGHDFYFHVGLWPDGRPGEVFMETSTKEGSFVHAVVGQLATMISIALQHGAPFEKILEKLSGARFDPAGFTGDPEVTQATSFLDAFAQWARKRFATPVAATDNLSPKIVNVEATAGPYPLRPRNLSGRLCERGCGPMDQEGTCWRCPQCGTSTGGCGG